MTMAAEPVLHQSMMIDHLALLRAIQNATKEGQTKLAARLGVSQATVGRWFRRVDMPAHDQRMKIELVARQLGVLKEAGAGKSALILGVIKADGSVQWADAGARKMATDSSVAGLLYVVWDGPPSLDGSIQPGTRIGFDPAHINPDATHFAKTCLVFQSDGTKPDCVGVLRSKVSTSKRDRRYRFQTIGSGIEIEVVVSYICLVREFQLPA